MKKFLLIPLLTILLSACHPYAYLPEMYNPPQLTDKNDLQVQLNGGRGANLNMAYSPLNGLGLIAGGYLMGLDSQKAGYRIRKGFDLGAGYYRKLNDQFLLEIYAGAGAGHNRAFRPGTSTMSDTSYYYLNNQYTQVFVSPAISFVSTYFTAGFSCTFSGVRFNNDMIDQEITRGTDPHVYYNQIPIPQQFVLAEPSLYLKAGIRNVKIIFQFAVPTRLGKVSDPDLLNDNIQLYYPTMASIGIQLMLNTKQ